MEIKAELNYLRIAPRKVRLAADMIKGLDARRAILALHHLPKRSALPIEKLIRSAIANASHNFQLDEQGLYIKDIRVNQGTMLKRFTPRAFGRAAPIRKKTSHVLLTLDTRTASPARLTKKEKQEGPIVRDITREDIKDEFIGQSGGEKAQSGEHFHKLKAKPTNFVRRVFKRKVI